MRRGFREVGRLREVEPFKTEKINDDKKDSNQGWKNIKPKTDITLDECRSFLKDQFKKEVLDKYNESSDDRIKELKLKIYESAMDDDVKLNYINIIESCDDSEFQDVYESIELILAGEELMSESVISPMAEFRKKLGEIRNRKPDEYSNTEEIDTYIDRHYNDLIKSSEILEQEPQKLRSNEVKYCIGIILGYIGAFLLLPVSETGAVIGLMIWLVTAFVFPIIEYIRISDDRKSMDELSKIKKALIRVKDKKGLSSDQKRKISSVIDKIDDVEIECNERIKNMQ